MARRAFWLTRWHRRRIDSPVGSPCGEERMTRRLAKLAGIASAIGLMVMAWTPADAVELDPKAVVYKLPDKIEGKRNAAGTAEQAVLAGDPSKPGLYVVLNKWLPGNMSRPHWHPNDRFIT